MFEVLLFYLALLLILLSLLIFLYFYLNQSYFCIKYFTYKFIMIRSSKILFLMSDIFTSWSIFLTTSLTLGISFFTASKSSSSSLVNRNRYFTLNLSYLIIIICFFNKPTSTNRINVFNQFIIYTVFLTTSFFTTLACLLKSVGTGTKF